MNVSPRILILPGLGNSGPEHWQSLWEAAYPNAVRVQQADWDTPRRADWVATLEAAIAHADSDVVLVTHSSSCALVGFWVRQTQYAYRVQGALLVAPSDTEATSYPDGPTGFAPMPLERLPFRSIVVASINDEYVTIDRAKEFAAAWGSEFVNVGAAGHINAAAGFGAWPHGEELLRSLIQG
jgi:predicted alpha/beta hydrolase family esterase